MENLIKRESYEFVLGQGKDQHHITVTRVKLDTTSRTLPEVPFEFYIITILDAEGRFVLL